MCENKSPAPEVGAQARDVWRVGNTEVKFSREGLSFRVLHTSHLDSEQAHSFTK